MSTEELGLDMQLDMSDPFVSASQTARKIGEEVSRGVHITPLNLHTIIGAWATGGHALIEGRFGTGKTTLAEALATVTGGTSARIQGTPDVTASDITGGLIYNEATGKFDFERGPIFANVVLADEIQRMLEKPQAGLTEAMQEGKVTPAGSTITYSVPDPQLVVATRNADGFVAPNIVDRFTASVVVSDQTAEDRRKVLAIKRARPALNVVSSSGAILELINTTAEVDTTGIEDAANSMIDSAYMNPGVDQLDSIQGGSRTFLNILGMAQYFALLRGRNSAIGVDLALGARAAMPHRIAVTYKAEAQGVTPLKIVAETAKRLKIHKIGELAEDEV